MRKDTLAAISKPWKGTKAFAQLLEQIDQAIFDLREAGASSKVFACTENIKEWLVWDRYYEVFDIMNDFKYHIHDKYRDSYLVERDFFLDDKGTEQARYSVRNHLRVVGKGGFIPPDNTDLDQIISRLPALSAAPAEVQQVALAAIGDIVDQALSPDAKSWVNREKIRRARPTADVELPADAQERWINSFEKAQADTGAMKLDDAIIGFTKRVYRGFLPGNSPVGMAITDYKDLDKPLYNQLVGLKKRINSRLDKTWPEGFPFPSRAARNDFILDQIKASELLPPSNPKVYASMKSSFRKRHDTNLDLFLENSTAATR